MLDITARPPEASQEAPVAFTGDGGAFLRMMFKGALLQLVTLGFYRFWFLTNIRRRLWSDTAIDGDAFEYTGRGKELLIGFLFALAILAPFYILYFLAGLEAERLKAFASFPLFLVFYLFGQFAMFRARRYRLTRTIWRGIRFWMTGSGVKYALRSFGWAILATLTLGLLYPWREASLERYKMRNTYYGDLQGRFVGTGWGLFKKGAWIWLVDILVILVPWILFAVKLANAGAAHSDDDPVSGTAFADVKGWIILGSISPVVAVLLWPVYQAIEWKWWLDGLRIGEVRVSSRLSRSTIFGLYLGLFGVLIVLGLCAALFIGLPMAMFGGASDGPPIGLLVYFAFVYIAALLVVGAFFRYFLQFRLWAAVMRSLTVYDLAAAANVQARGEAANALGEGLADGLDVAGF